MLTSTRNPLVKQLRQLGDSARERREQQQFIVEGTRAIAEVLATGYPLAIVCHTERWQQQHPDLYARCLAVADRVEVVADPVLGAIATTTTPAGIVAVVPMQARPPVQLTSLGLALESIRDPGNFGSIVRSAVAAGADGMWVSADSVDITHPKILRATAGQWFRCAMQVTADLRGEIAAWQARGGRAIAAVARGDCLYWEWDFTQPTLILLGNEGNGLSSGILQQADAGVSIPMAKGVESLNVGICAALLLYEAQRQRRAVPAPRSPFQQAFP